jgi:hypothetical protein
LEAPDLAAAVERLRLQDGRWRAVQADVRAGVVRLRGSGAAGEDLFGLARAASRLPGVARVVLEGGPGRTSGR